MIKEEPDVVLEKFPYRYITWGTLDNGDFDCRIQKWHEDRNRYYDMYLCDNTQQMNLAIEDFEYTKWLDPDPEVAAYPRKSDTVRSPYAT